MSILCPKCNERTSTIDSRLVENRHTVKTDLIRRRKKCRLCGHRFSTLEMTFEMVKNLISEGAQLRILRDALSGSNDFANLKKNKSVPMTLLQLTDQRKRK